MSLIYLKTAISEYENKIIEMDSKIKITKDIIKWRQVKFNDRKRLYSYEPYDNSDIEPKVCLKSIKIT